MKRLYLAIFSLMVSASAFADNGCPGDHLVGVHTAPGTAWNISIHDGGTVVITRIGGDGTAKGDATLKCIDGTVLAKFRNMTNGIKYDCVGELDGSKLRSNMTCINSDTGTLVGHIRAYDANFE